jgi:8-oxo-dGTP diphosphatase
LPLLDDWIACPRCRAGLVHGERSVECPACGFAEYANPAPTACAVCVDDEGRILLVRRAAGVFGGYWDLPGGFLDEDEHPVETLRRELHEETGLDVEPLDFLGFWMDRYSEDDSGPSTLNLYWTARVIGGDPEAADDVSELQWFAPHGLPPAEEIAFRNVADVLQPFREEGQRSRPVS